MSIKKTVRFSEPISQPEFLVTDPRCITTEELNAVGVPIENRIVFFLEKLGTNGYAIVVPDELTAEVVLRNYVLNVSGRDVPRLAHYLQVLEQQKNRNITYYGTMINVPRISIEQPLVGKINYILAQSTRSTKFLAIVILSS